MLFWVEQAFVGREEIRAPLKTPAWEARTAGALNKTIVIIIKIMMMVMMMIIEGGIGVY